MRSLLLAILLVALSAAPAHAVLAEQYAPFKVKGFVAQDGTLRATKEAAAVYRKRLAGRRLRFDCSEPGGEIGSWGGELFAPKRRSRFSIRLEFPSELCTISTRDRGYGFCYGSDENHWCIRAAVPVTDAGRVRLDESAASLDVLLMGLYAAGFDRAELVKAFAAYQGKVVELPSAEASPPPGVIGIHWGADGRVTTVVVTPQGVRRFLTLGHEYLATNTLDFIDFKLPSLT
jgi:hypothetical protein